MTTYTEFAEKLARGQLKNTSAVEQTNLGEICPDYSDTIRNLTNQGLVDITTRLPLIRKLVDLTFVDGQALYPLDSAALNTYLDDTDSDVAAFIEDAFVKILDVYDANGVRYQPNTGGHITTPVYNSVRFSAAYMDSNDFTYIGPKIRIQYQAKHVEILVGDIGNEINLPPNMIAALQLYVAAAYIADMGGKENVKRGDGYFALYLRHVTEDQIRNTSGTSEVEEDSRFYDNGFV